MGSHRVSSRTALLSGYLVMAALLLVGLGLLASGCGEATTTTTVPPVTTTLGPQPEGGGIVGTQVVPSESTPFEVSQALTQNQPLVVLFYVAGGTDDQPVRDSLSTIAARYPDVMFALYDYKLPSAYGDLSAILQVGYTPYTVFIGNDGKVAYVVMGYADEAVLQQYVDNLQQGA